MGKGKRFVNNDVVTRKKAVFYILGISVLSIIIISVFAFSAYKSKKIAESQIAALDFAKNIVVKDEDMKSASFSEDKGVNEVDLDTNSNINPINTIIDSEKIAINTEKLESDFDDIEETATEPENVVLEFVVPLEGEITKDFSDSALVYSETLKEWTTHQGVDIKAEKGSAVSASESGVVESIKNDPRYGLTITISHANGFKTVYSNLLSAEFVNEGDTVNKGQTIGSVGSSGVFEIAESEHLHFEMWENGVCVNPANYWTK